MVHARSRDLALAGLIGPEGGVRRLEVAGWRGGALRIAGSACAQLPRHWPGPSDRPAHRGAVAAYETAAQAARAIGGHKEVSDGVTTSSAINVGDCPGTVEANGGAQSARAGGLPARKMAERTRPARNAAIFWRPAIWASVRPVDVSNQRETLACLQSQDLAGKVRITSN